MDSEVKETRNVSLERQFRFSSSCKKCQRKGLSGTNKSSTIPDNRFCTLHQNLVRWGPLVSEPRLQLLYNTSKETARDSASSILQMAIRNSDKTDGLVGKY